MLWNEVFETLGKRWDGKEFKDVEFECIITQENISISDGNTQFTIPLKSIEKYFK